MGNRRRRYLIRVLREAYTMETRSTAQLTASVQQLHAWPVIRARAAAHLSETEDQRRLLAASLAGLRAGPSLFANFSVRLESLIRRPRRASSPAAAVAALGDSYLFEQMEIAVYTVAIAAAQAAGEPAVQETCEAILAQERRMADWLLEHLADPVRSGPGR
ncbi:DUF892 family protein [Paraburkholderia guartelaensis]|uniref:DUF892 family protein n=1 Tax=Paraburkholderia guartelaensis TaxID=2546446 RepID=A0A4R5L2E9_9BURK|nr:DUF892 family protein [Paraburkholderia guartelaensis]